MAASAQMTSVRARLVHVGRSSRVLASKFHIQTFALSVYDGFTLVGLSQGPQRLNCCLNRRMLLISGAGEAAIHSPVPSGPGVYSACSKAVIQVIHSSPPGSGSVTDCMLVSGVFFPFAFCVHIRSYRLPFERGARRPVASCKGLGFSCFAFAVSLWVRTRGCIRCAIGSL